MKLLFDHNLSYKLVTKLQELYPDSQHVREAGHSSANDDVVWAYAREKQLSIVSKDSDFFNRSMVLGHPPKVVWIRLGNCTTDQIFSLLKEEHATLNVFDKDSNASFIVLR